jgi:hypothetical protein
MGIRGPETADAPGAVSRACAEAISASVEVLKEAGSSLEDRGAEKRDRNEGESGVVGLFMGGMRKISAIAGQRVNWLHC